MKINNKTLKYKITCKKLAYKVQCEHNITTLIGVRKLQNKQLMILIIDK